VKPEACKPESRLGCRLKLSKVTSVSGCVMDRNLVVGAAAARGSSTVARHAGARDRSCVFAAASPTCTGRRFGLKCVSPSARFATCAPAQPASVAQPRPRRAAQPLP
jgi:hypothetical protein